MFSCRQLLVIPVLLAMSVGTRSAEPGPVVNAGDDPTEYGLRAPAQPSSAKALPRTTDGRPDLTGVWFAGIRGFTHMDDTTVAIPLKPDYAKVRKIRSDAIAAGKPLSDFVSTCQAFGMPRVMSYGNFEIVQHRRLLVVITEVLHEVRRIYLDGVVHGAGQLDSFDGVSTGHWDGDTLVVRTNKLRAGYFDLSGAPHSDKLTVVERIRMVNPNAIENEMTLTDPLALDRPWVVVQRYERRPKDYEIGEYICSENLRTGTDGPSPESMLPKSAVSPAE